MLSAHAELPVLIQGSGEEIWQRAISGWSVSAIALDVADLYGIPPGESSEAVRQYCTELVERGILAPDDDEELGVESANWNILTVCTGNICRSLFAERVLAKEIASRGGRALVTSAGVSARHGRAVPKEMLAVLRESGFDGSDHSPRQLSLDLVSKADLILTATVDHRREVLKMSPLAMRKTFTVLEAAAAIEASAGAVGAPQGAIRTLAAARTAIPGGTLLDVADPFGRPAENYDMMVTLMSPALGAIAAYATAR